MYRQLIVERPKYCLLFQVTANLVESRIGVDPKWVNRIPLWKTREVAGVKLTLMEANQCVYQAFSL